MAYGKMSGKMGGKMACGKTKAWKGKGPHNTPSKVMRESRRAMKAGGSSHQQGGKMSMKSMMYS